MIGIRGERVIGIAENPHHFLLFALFDSLSESEHAKKDQARGRATERRPFIFQASVEESLASAEQIPYQLSGSYRMAPAAPT